MQNKFALLAAAILPMLLIGVIPADATYVTGYLKDSGVGVAGTVTAERVGNWYYDTASGSGYFAINTSSGSFYYVDGFDTDYTRDSTTGYDNNWVGTLDIDTRSDRNILIKVMYDDDTGVSYADARDEILTSEHLFRDQHSIDFILSTSGSSVQYDSTPIGNDCDDHLTEIRSEANWETSGFGSYDILWAVTDGGFTDTGGACMRSHDTTSIPDEAGKHPYTVMDLSRSTSTEKLGMHELTHAYGMDHVNSSCSGQIPGIMATETNGGTEVQCSSSVFITNWVPGDDDTMEDNRLWY